MLCPCYLRVVLWLGEVQSVDGACVCVCVQYKTEKDGIQETRVEHKVVLASADDNYDYDAVSTGNNLCCQPLCCVVFVSTVC